MRCIAARPIRNLLQSVTSSLLLLRELAGLGPRRGKLIQLAVRLGIPIALSLAAHKGDSFRIHVPVPREGNVA